MIEQQLHQYYRCYLICTLITFLILVNCIQALVVTSDAAPLSTVVDGSTVLPYYPDREEVISAPGFNESINQIEVHQIIGDLYDKNTEDQTLSRLIIDHLHIVDFNDTSVLIEWSFNAGRYMHGFPDRFLVELSEGPINEDFKVIEEINLTAAQDELELSTTILSQRYLVANLHPLSTYRVRIVPLFHIGAGRGFPSIPLLIKTIASPVNYWEQILPRRTSKNDFGRGYSNPLTSRPHLSSGVEIYAQNTRKDPIWYTDAPTAETPLYPSGRRGHSLTLIDNYVYMFGGRTNGYSCASTLIDILNFGSQYAGLDIYPCITMQSEVSELWKLDISTYEWEFINTTAFSSVYNRSHPSARELHASTTIDGNLLIFGGKSRLHAKSASGRPIMTNASDLIFNDMWLLDIDHLKNFRFNWNPQIAHLVSYQPEIIKNQVNFFPLIPQDRRYELSISVDSSEVVNYYAKQNIYKIFDTQEGQNPRNSQCLKDVSVRVLFYHDCVTQLKMTLKTSGPVMGSPNYFPNNNNEFEILLLNGLKSNMTDCISGVYEFIFNDNNRNNIDSRLATPASRATAAPNAPNIARTGAFPATSIKYENSNRCCFDGAQFVHYYQTNGKLSELIDNSLVNDYTLVVEDMKADSLRGQVIDYEIILESISCHPIFEWKRLNYSTNLQNRNNIPIPRYDANIVSYNYSVFIFGGKDVENTYLQDLFRYDLLLNRWTNLKPVGFYDNPLDTANALGASFLVTSYGIIRFGGYYRQPYLSKVGRNFAKNDRDNSDRLRHDQIDSTDNNNFDNNVFVMDPITMKWQMMNISILSRRTINTNLTNSNNYFHYTKNPFDLHLPKGRYYSAMTFIPSHALSWKQQLLQTNNSKFSVNNFYNDLVVPSDFGYNYDNNERILYDNHQIAYQGNYQSFSADSILLYGGFDIAIGGMIDGAGSGFLQDTWLLRLNSYSTRYSRRFYNSYREKHCAWRTNPSARNSFGTHSCLSRTAGTNCRFRDMVMFVWCSQFNQTMS